jgi:CYTH domain-containing protein
MAKEIERKFKVVGDSWRSQAMSSSSFRQAYIASGDDRSIRVRIMDGERAKLTIKIGRNLIARDEFEYDIPIDDAEQLAECAVGVVLEKTRYKVDHRSYTWEIDVYAGAYAGLVVAEVEMEDESAEPELPEWVGTEVTGDRRYSNMVMATEDLSSELVHGLPSARR